MDLTYLALVLAGQGDVNHETPDPLGPMDLSNLTIATSRVGICPGDIGNSAQVEARWRVTNRDDANYKVSVFLIEAGAPPLYALGAEPLDGFTGFSYPTFAQGYIDAKTGFGRLDVLGVIEDGAFNRQTTDWIFHVVLTRNSEVPTPTWLSVLGKELRRLTIPWRKTYGTCS